MKLQEPIVSKRRVRHCLQRALYWTGGAAAYNRLYRAAGATILMYHSVAPAKVAWAIDPRIHVKPEVFERQVRFLARHRKVLRMSELVEMVRLGACAERGTVVITFDDGYLDNLEIAAPVLERYGLPAVLYLPTGYIQGGQPQWVDRLFATFRARTRQRLQLDHADGRSFDLSTETRACRVYEPGFPRWPLPFYAAPDGFAL